MARPEKEQAVAEILDAIQNNEIAIATTYVGISVKQVSELRAKLREADIKYKVYKNTLAKRALDELGLEPVGEYMNGPTAWAFCKDPVAPTKIFKEVSAEIEFVKMSGGVLSGKPVNADQLTALADLPPREVLLAQAIGTMAAPLRNFVTALNALPTNLVNVLDQIKKQKEEGGAAAEG